MATEFRAVSGYMGVDAPMLRGCGRRHGGECGAEGTGRVPAKKPGPSPAELAERKQIIAEAKRKLAAERQFNRTQSATLVVNAKRDGVDLAGFDATELLFSAPRALSAEEKEWQRSMPAPPDPYEQALAELRWMDKYKEANK